MEDVDLASLPVLDFPPLTDDPEEAKAHLDEYGACILADVLTPLQVEEIDVRLLEQAAGEEALGLGSKMRGDEGLGVKTAVEERVSRLVWNLINKGTCFLSLIDHPKILPLVKHILGEKLILCSTGAHMNGPGNELMALHQDQFPLIPHNLPFAAMCNVLFLITDNSPQNGGTRIVPGSHKWPPVPYRQMNAPEGRALAKSITAPKGSALVIDGRLWHSNGLNRSNALRSNITNPYLQPWVRPQENHQYSVRPEVFERANDIQKELMGFSEFGSLGGHDGSSVSPARFDRDKESIGILSPSSKEA